MKEVNPVLKFLLEIGPLAVFFGTFTYGAEILANPSLFGALEVITGPAALEGKNGPIFVATACFMVAIAISLGVSWGMTRSLPKMAVVTGVVVVIFGGLTLWLQDDTFIKMKPTIVNGIFAVILFVGLVQGRSYLKYLMGDSVPLSDQGWLIFTKRWVGFFLFMALLNELIWRTQTTEFWVSFKTFGNMPLTLLFMALQYPLLREHMQEE
ncbi:MAG: septation protein A [Pseudomonadota bacterium]